MLKLKSLIKSYEAWVAANPETACDLETTTKWVSYFIAGRISNSNVVSELIYSLSNILVLYNDRIIHEADCKRSLLGGGDIFSRNRLKVMLTVLEYSEVFIEISAKRIFGQKGKWLFVVVLQVVKAAGRFFILKHSTEQIVTTPAMPSLNRREMIKKQKQAAIAGSTHNDRLPETSNKPPFVENSITFQLKRSGRLVRKVEGAPPLPYRDFKLIENNSGNNDANKLSHSESLQKTKMPKVLLYAECLYIAKPLIHLAAMGVFGQKRWKQYVVAFTLDLISIRMYYRNRHLMNKQQKLEMSRRCINLLLYLMRSPFYERYTRTRVDRTLAFVVDHVPLIRMIAAPLKEYIPHWQSTYFYLWST